MGDIVFVMGVELLNKMKNNKCDRKKEMAIGIKMEMAEHGALFPKKTRKKMIEKITGNHLDEFDCYYTKGLLPMEKRLKKMELKKLTQGI